ncbi:MAG: hypothetical protein WD894_16220 [Pirellulales bacterium]
MAKKPEKCQWVTLRDALRAFAEASTGTTSQRHIKPLNWYLSCRLCLEGGFSPEEVHPRPPFRVLETGKGRSHRRILEHDPILGGHREQVVLGGLKTKQVDIVVTKPGIGPVIAVSTKGTLNAFRNLTNRLEEAGGDCTNLHLTYPTLVYAYWGLIRGNRAGKIGPQSPKTLGILGEEVRKADIAINKKGDPSTQIRRYHDALVGLAQRKGIRNDVSKYEAVALTIVNVEASSFGQVYVKYPTADSDLHWERLMQTIYQQYDLRFVYQAPDLLRVTGRRGWDEDSPALKDPRASEYEPRLHMTEEAQEEDVLEGLDDEDGALQTSE